MHAVRSAFFGLLLLAAVPHRMAPTLPLPAAPDGHERDRAAITRTVERFVDAWNQHDAHAFAATFTEDADFTNIAGAHAAGRSNVEAFHAPMFASIFEDSHQTATVRSIRFLKPDLAAVDVDWQMTGAKFPDGSPRPLRKGLVNWVMARQGDGSWLIEIMHNTDLTSAFSPPASAPRP
jgi:uncharacterized protein (TIGR02246 family)